MLLHNYNPQRKYWITNACSSMLTQKEESAHTGMSHQPTYSIPIWAQILMQSRTLEHHDIMQQHSRLYKHHNWITLAWAFPLVEACPESDSANGENTRSCLQRWSQKTWLGASLQKRKPWGSHFEVHLWTLQAGEPRNPLFTELPHWVYPTGQVPPEYYGPDLAGQQAISVHAMQQINCARKAWHSWSVSFGDICL